MGKQMDGLGRVPRVCINCGTSFFGKTNAAKYCSDKVCRSPAGRKRVERRNKSEEAFKQNLNGFDADFFQQLEDIRIAALELAQDIIPLKEFYQAVETKKLTEAEWASAILSLYSSLEGLEKGYIAYINSTIDIAKTIVLDEKGLGEDVLESLDSLIDIPELGKPCISFENGLEEDTEDGEESEQL